MAYNLSGGYMLPSCSKINLQFLVPVNRAYSGAINLPDGRVFFIPANHIYAAIYDPPTNSIAVPGVTFQGNGAVNGGCLLNDGRVFMTPSNSYKAKIYNPYNESLIDAGGIFPGNYAYLGSTTMLDGRVFMAPHNASQAAIYDPLTDTTTFIGSFPGLYKFAGAQLLPDGRIFMTPHNYVSAYIFDPQTNTFDEITGFPGNESFVGQCLLPNGKILLSPHKYDRIIIVDPVAMTLQYSNVIFGTIGVSMYRGCFPLPDGRVFIIPYQSTKAKVYNYIDDTVYSPPGTYEGNGALSSGVIMQNGRLILPAYSGTYNVLSAVCGDKIDSDIYLDIKTNKC